MNGATPGTPGKAKIGKRTSHMNQLSYLRDSDSLLRANVAEPERLNLISPDDAVRMENPRQCEFNFSAMNDTTDFRMLADTMRRAGKFETEALIYYNMALDLDSDGEWTQAAAMYEKHLAVCQRMRDRALPTVSAPAPAQDPVLRTTLTAPASPPPRP